MLLNNRATFYMLVLEGQSYVPRIKNLCGTLVELEEIKNHLRQPKEYCKGFIKIQTNSNYKFQ